jgi:hypothetical protein
MSNSQRDGLGDGLSAIGPFRLIESDVAETLL